MDINDIKKFVSDALASYQIHGDELFINYIGVPKELKMDDEKKDYIDGLNIQNRLDFFQKKLLFVENEYIFIYPIWGLIAFPKNSLNTIFGCQLYSPDIEKVFGENSFFDETFDTSNIEEKDKKYYAINGIDIIHQQIYINQHQQRSQKYVKDKIYRKK